MKLVFLSNYYNHHQMPSCENWYRLTDGAFTFVTTQPFSQERKALGWSDDTQAPFLLRLAPETEGAVAQQIREADVVIRGDAPADLVRQRLAQGGPVFQYSERLFKHGYGRGKWLVRRVRYWLRIGRYRSLYLLAASGYATGDYHKCGVFRGKSYKWGYFPPLVRHDIRSLLESKKTDVIVWCGRLLDWKHPDDAVEVARRLKEAGYPFRMEIIGSGPMEEQLKEQIRSHGLSDRVALLGSMRPEQVRAHMESAGICLLTSDMGEGWGAVLNEAMNSGCAVVASHAMGAVPFLLEHGKDGLIYESGCVDGLYRKTRWLLDRPDQQQRLGERAYRTIAELWNAEVAARRFLELAEQVREKGSCDLFPDGPCSPADDLENDWFKEYGEADMEGLPGDL